MEIKKGAGFVNKTSGQNDKTVIYKGVEVGVVEGYIATWDLDRGNDVFLKGAFKDSIEEWKRQGRDIKAKDMHGESIGVYPVEQLYEDDKGLFGKAYINLELQSGREAMSKARMGIYDRKSIGFSANPEHTKGEFPFGREIGKAHIWEGSLVDEPMNLAAQITSVKAHCTDTDVRLGLVDEVTGRMVLSKRSLGKAFARLEDNRLKLSKSELEDAKARLKGYFQQCELEMPKGDDMLGEILGNAEEIQQMSVRELEDALKSSGCSAAQSKAFLAKLKETDSEVKEIDNSSQDISDDDCAKILAMLEI